MIYLCLKRGIVRVAMTLVRVLLHEEEKRAEADQIGV